MLYRYSSEKIKKQLERLGLTKSRFCREHNWGYVSFHGYAENSQSPAREQDRKRLAKDLDLHPKYLWNDLIPPAEDPPSYYTSPWGRNFLDIPPGFPLKLKAAIEDSGLSYVQVAQEAGVSLATLQRYRDPSIGRVNPIQGMQVAAAVGVPWKYLMDEGQPLRRRARALPAPETPRSPRKEVSVTATTVNPEPDRLDRIERKLDALGRKFDRLLRGLGEEVEVEEPPQDSPPSPQNGDLSYLESRHIDVW